MVRGKCAVYERAEMINSLLRPRMDARPCCTVSASRSSCGGKGQLHTPNQLFGSSLARSGRLCWHHVRGVDASLKQPGTQ